MDPLGTNKLLAAGIGAALVFMAIRTVPEFIMHPEVPDIPVYIIGDPNPPPPGGEDVELPFPQASWVAAMDAERGARVFKKCTSCHNIEAGEPHGTGPNLYSVVMRKSGEASGYGYSDAMASAGYAWDWEHLDGFLEKPSKYLAGTKMNFVGLKKAEDRAAVIEYLRIAAANPVPRPEAAAVVGLTEAAQEAEGIPPESQTVRDPSATNEDLDGDDNSDELFGDDNDGGADGVSEMADPDNDEPKAPGNPFKNDNVPFQGNKNDTAERLTPEQEEAGR